MLQNDTANFVSRDFKSLTVWNKSVEFSVNIYRLTKEAFPKYETYGLSSQGQRSSSSIPLNIAEGNSFTEFPKKELSFYYNALGSLQETRAFLELSLRLEYIDQNTFDKLEQDAQVILRLLVGMMKRVKSKIA